MARVDFVAMLLPRFLHLTRTRLSRLAVLLLAVTAPAFHLAAQEQAVPELATLRQFYQHRDFFALREALEPVSDLTDGAAELIFFLAATQQAFNRPVASNQTLQGLLRRADLDADLIPRLRALELTNHLRLHNYNAALESAEAVLSALSSDSESGMAIDVRGKLPLLQALADVPPQEVEIRAASRLALGKTGRVPLRIQGVKYAFALDTGANFSVIMRSEAEKLKLGIRPANLVISTSTTRQVTGDVAIAEEVEIGKIRYRNVVFLVLPDEVLSFPDGQRIPGLVGFPLVSAMGDVRFRRDNVLEIPRRSPRRTEQNLALDDLDPLVQVRYGKENLICRLDTGAQLTIFYEPFFRQFSERIRSSGHRVTAKATGVGGSQEIAAYRLPSMALTIASAGVNLRRIEIYTEPIRGPEENFLHCNVGLDAFSKFRSYTLNFRDMALVLD